MIWFIIAAALTIWATVVAVDDEGLPGLGLGFLLALFFGVMAFLFSILFGLTYGDAPTYLAEKRALTSVEGGDLVRIVTIDDDTGYTYFSPNENGDPVLHTIDGGHVVRLFSVKDADKARVEVHKSDAELKAFGIQFDRADEYEIYVPKDEIAPTFEEYE